MQAGQNCGDDGAGLLRNESPLDTNPARFGNPVSRSGSGAVGQVAAESWRNEVTSRLQQYRSRRRPVPIRYPSLQLKFEPKPRTSESIGESRQAPPVVEDFSQVEASPTADPTVGESRVLRLDAPPEPILVAPANSARILAFPRPEFQRSVPLPPRPLDRLADPVIERPRILDVPEVAPTPPAMGGISIEPMETSLELKRPGFEMPLQPAPMFRRFLAGGIDAALIALGLAVFGYLIFRLSRFIPPMPQGILMLGITAAFFWAGYQYLFIVHEGATPGLRLARLRLSCFDGAPVRRSRRRWRVWSAVLSGFALGLGYAWCLLDEDQLCWHDRITRTYIAPK